MRSWLKYSRRLSARKQTNRVRDNTEKTDKTNKRGVTITDKTPAGVGHDADHNPPLRG